MNRVSSLVALAVSRSVLLPRGRNAVLVAGLLAALALPLPAVAEEPSIQFNRDIRPILSENCYQCHGPDEKTRAAKLRLDTREGATAARKSGAAVVPGKSGESSLITRIITTETGEQMPPPESGKKLTPQQIALLKKWIDQGAGWQGHWSFIAAQRPQPPQVRNEPAVRNAIDRFIVARLEKEKLRPSKPADRITLIRRVTLDLTGLPPTIAEMDAALNDPSRDWYERLVDRLLNSPRYGEQQARHWLDLARYGDTHGLHFDNERALWRYRDWVIDAFNANKRFDRFTIEQLAGDLLPNATLEQRVATGFNRCNVTTSEGGSINDEVLVRYAVDRTETMATVFLGLTLGCAVCHDHKFDPVSQKEFYRLYAFFNAAADAAMDGNALGPPPILKMPTAAQEARLKALDEQLAVVRKNITEAVAKADPMDEPPTTEEASNEPKDIVWVDDAAPKGAQVSGNTPWEFVTGPDHPVHSGKKSMRRSAQGISQHFFEKAEGGLRIGEGDKLYAHVYLDPQALPKTIMLQFNDGVWEHRAFWGEDSIPWGTSGSPSRLAMGPLPKAGEWVRLEIETSKIGLKSGTVVTGMAFTQHDGTVYWDKVGLLTRTPQGGQSFVSQAEWEAYQKAQTKSTIPQPIKDALKVAADKRTDAHKKTLRDYYVEHVAVKTRSIFEPLHKELASLDKEKKDLDAAIPMTMVMADLPKPRDTFVLIRGAYDKKGEKVTAGVPEVFPPLPTDAPLNRLGLAQWLTDPKHPLTARVAVNRFWQQYFGRGLVKTSEDFGLQGEWPSHPELLDWLAVEFIESGWDIKALQKLMVMSATYQQGSEVSPELLKRDPENMLLGRGPRFRLDAEVVRDSALYLSGLLHEQIGGRSVKPYQPPGIWEAIGFNGSTTREYKRESGTALYRRSLYTFWKRTAPPPSLMAFDAPSRENCVARRARTNTPLQALVLMNDEQYVEAARNLAERMMTNGGATPAERLAFGFRLATSRKPTEKETEVLLKLYDKQLTRFQGSPEAANKLLAVGESKRNATLDAAEHAAYTMSANLILNLDETISKE
ncbi:MAG: PSD1 domain-containing protein [Planctomycetia bacterium]|nr:PSD1 domain-containing protein [Planctomycetia bacterium]